MTVSPTSDLAALAERIVGHALAHDGRLPSELFGQMQCHLAPYIRAAVRRRRLPAHSGVSEEDVVQEVLTRLFVSRLNRPQATGRPAVTLLAWVKTVTHRHLTDLGKKFTGRFAAEEEEALSERPASQRNPLWTKLAYRDALEHLDAHYPPGASLLRLLGEEPDADTSELAARLNTSTSNVYQIKTRMLRSLAVCFEDPASWNSAEERTR